MSAKVIVKFDIKLIKDWYIHPRRCKMVQFMTVQIASVIGVYVIYAT